MTTYDLTEVPENYRLEFIKSTISLEQRDAEYRHSPRYTMSMMSRGELEDLCLYLIERNASILRAGGK